MTFRDVRNIDIKKFRTDISSSNLNIDHDDDLAKRVEQYNSVLQELIDAHASLVTCSVILRPNAPLFNKELRESKHLKRRCESEKWWSLALKWVESHFMTNAKHIGVI